MKSRSRDPWWWSDQFNGREIHAISPRIPCQNSKISYGCVSSYVEVRQRRGPAASAPSILEEGLSSEEGGFKGKRLPPVDTRWNRIFEIFYLPIADGDLRVDERVDHQGGFVGGRLKSARRPDKPLGILRCDIEEDAAIDESWFHATCASRQGFRPYSF